MLVALIHRRFFANPYLGFEKFHQVDIIEQMYFTKAYQI